MLTARSIPPDIRDLFIAIVAVLSMTPFFYFVIERLMFWLDIPL